MDNNALLPRSDDRDRIESLLLASSAGSMLKDGYYYYAVGCLPTDWSLRGLPLWDIGLIWIMANATMLRSPVWPPRLSRGVRAVLSTTAFTTALRNVWRGERDTPADGVQPVYWVTAGTPLSTFSSDVVYIQ